MATKKTVAAKSVESEMKPTAVAAAKTKKTSGKKTAVTSAATRGKKTTAKKTGKKPAARKTTKTQARKTTGKRTSGAKRSQVASRKTTPAVTSDSTPATHVIAPLEFESTMPAIGDPSDSGMTFASELPSMTASAAVMPAADNQPLTMLDMNDLFPSMSRSEEIEPEIGFDTDELAMEEEGEQVEVAEAVRQPGAWHLVGDLYMISVLYSLILLSGLYWLLGLGGPEAFVNSAAVALEGINQLKLAYLGS